MSRSILLVAIVSVMVFALLACGSSTDAPELTESVEDVSGETDRSAGSPSGSITAGEEVSAQEVAAAAAAGVALFPDPLFEERVRATLNQPEGPILISDLKQVTEFGSGGALYVSDLTGLEHFVNITDYNVSQNTVTDISPLVGLTNLTRLNISYNDITDISPLASLTNLTFLWFQNNVVSDISALASLTKLTDLNIRQNEISDISALASLTNLTVLELKNNNISDLSPLASLSKLTDLSLSRNDITDISPLIDIGLGEGTRITLYGLPLDTNSIEVVIPQLKAAGVNVLF